MERWCQYFLEWLWLLKMLKWLKVFDASFGLGIVYAEATFQFKAYHIATFFMTCLRGDINEGSSTATAEIRQKQQQLLQMPQPTNEQLQPLPLVKVIPTLSESIILSLSSDDG